MKPKTRKPSVELLCGDWRDRLKGLKCCDSVITDPPYCQHVSDNYQTAKRDGSEGSLGSGRGNDRYDDLSKLEIRDMVSRVAGWRPRWIVMTCDDRLAYRLRFWLNRNNYQTFAFVPMVKMNAAPNFSGCGPGHGAELIVVARRRGKDTMDGSRPGFYLCHHEAATLMPGQKPLGAMRALVRDYSRPGDLIVDPFCGTGTIALAALAENRRAIAVERDPKTYEIARRRLDAGHTASMF